MNYDNFIKLIDIIETSDITFFELQRENVRIVLKREKSIQQLAKAEIASTKKEDCLRRTTFIKSNLVGIYHDSNKFKMCIPIKAGSVVKRGQVLCIIESLGIMNEIRSEHDGVIKAIYSKNNQLVEYGQVLIEIEEIEY